MQTNNNQLYLIIVVGLRNYRVTRSFDFFKEKLKFGFFMGFFPIFERDQLI